MNILQIIPSLNPATGGPVEGPIQLGHAMRSAGHSVHVVTLDIPGTSLDKRIPSGAVFFLGPRKLKYGFSGHLRPWLQTHCAAYDVVLVHGLWQYHGYCVRKVANALSVPYVIFLHGMLDPWFKQHYPLKHLKKWLYWFWGEYRVLRDARFALFTTSEELSLARKSFWLYKVRERLVGYGIRSRHLPPPQAREAFLQKFPTLRDKRIVLYLSRVHPKKGCDLLINSFAKVAFTDDRLHLVIAGPDEMGWGKRLERDARVLGVATRVSFTGMVQGDIKWGAYDAAEVFVLPSHQENFGIVVAEALASGLPVLTTDKVNIWREIHASEAGFIAPDTQDGTDRLLAQWLEMSDADWRRMREHALECFRDHFEIDRVADQLIGALRQAVRGPGAFTYASSRPW